MTFLLDVSVLIALIDPMHVAHDTVHDWFRAEGSDSWATCPLTENGVVRIVSNSKYLHSPGPPAVVGNVLAGLREHPGHIFWPDDISVIDTRHIDIGSVPTSAHVTDAYLLALAKHRKGKLATLDRRLQTASVANGAAFLYIITVETKPRL